MAFAVLGFILVPRATGASQAESAAPRVERPSFGDHAIARHLEAAGEDAARIEVLDGRVLVVNAVLIETVFRGARPIIVGGDTHVTVRAGARARISWPGEASVLVQGPTSLEWSRGTEGLELTVGELGQIEFEVRRGRARLALPGAWRTAVEGAAVQLVGLANGTLELRLHAGPSLRLEWLGDPRASRPPVDIRAGSSVRLGVPKLRANFRALDAKAPPWPNEQVAWPWRAQSDTPAQVAARLARPERTDQPQGWLAEDGVWVTHIEAVEFEGGRRVIPLLLPAEELAAAQRSEAEARVARGLPVPMGPQAGEARRVIPAWEQAPTAAQVAPSANEAPRVEVWDFPAETQGVPAPNRYASAPASGTGPARQSDAPTPGPDKAPASSAATTAPAPVGLPSPAPAPTVTVDPQPVAAPSLADLAPPQTSETPADQRRPGRAHSAAEVSPPVPAQPRDEARPITQGPAPVAGPLPSQGPRPAAEPIVEPPAEPGSKPKPESPPDWRGLTREQLDGLGPVLVQNGRGIELRALSAGRVRVLVEATVAGPVWCFTPDTAYRIHPGATVVFEADGRERLRIGTIETD